MKTTQGCQIKKCLHKANCRLLITKVIEFKETYLFKNDMLMQILFIWLRVHGKQVDFPF